MHWLHILYPLKAYARVSFRVFFVLLAVSASQSVLADSEPQLKESKVRAAILYRLLQASRWTFNQEHLLTICELGNGDHAMAIRQLNEAPFGKNRTISIRSIDGDSTNTQKCDVIVIGPNEPSPLPNELSEHYLICNDCDQSKNHSAVNLYLFRDQVRYDINRTVASQAGVHFQSDALRLALNLSN